MNSIITDDNGRYILMNAKVQGSDYILGDIYAPNKIKEQCNFFVELQQKLEASWTILLPFKTKELQLEETLML